MHYPTIKPSKCQTGYFWKDTTPRAEPQSGRPNNGFYRTCTNHLAIIIILIH